jgi:hypothetical protein
MEPYCGTALFYYSSAALAPTLQYSTPSQNFETNESQPVVKICLSCTLGLRPELELSPRGVKFLGLKIGAQYTMG